MMSDEYRKFYACKAMTVRELKSLDLIDRIRYLLKRELNEKWTPAEVRKKLLYTGVICEHVTVQNIEDEMRSFYG